MQTSAASAAPDQPPASSTSPEKIESISEARSIVNSHFNRLLDEMEPTGDIAYDLENLLSRLGAYLDGRFNIECTGLVEREVRTTITLPDIGETCASGQQQCDVIMYEVCINGEWVDQGVVNPDPLGEGCYCAE